MPALEIDTLLLRDAHRDRLAHAVEPGVRHVAMRPALVFFDKGFQCVGKLYRRAQVGISQAEIEDIFLAELRLEPEPLLEHLPDP